MNGISELINSEVPSLLTGGNSVFAIAIWMLTGVIALFAGLNFKKIFSRSNFDILLIIFLLPMAVLFFGTSKALITVGVYFIGRIIFRFADKEDCGTSQLPNWLLIIVLIIGLGFTGFRVYVNNITQHELEYAVTAQDTFLTGKMPYSSERTKDLMPGPFAYTLTYLPLSISPVTVENKNECYQLTKIQNHQDLKAAESTKFIALNDFFDINKIKVNTIGLKIFNLFALLVFISGLFAIGLKFGSLKTAMFLLLLFLFLPWQNTLIISAWKVLAIGLFLWTIFFIKRTWIAGIFFAASVAVFPLLVLTLPLFIAYYMPNIGRKGLWLITLGILVTGFVVILFAPYFNQELFGFLPTKIFGIILLFIGLLSSLLLSLLGEREEKAPGGFMFSFLIVIILAVIAVVLMTSANNYTKGFEDFGQKVLGKIFTDGQGLNKIAVPVFMLILMLSFIPRNISEGGLVVLSGSLILFVTFAFGIATSGSELLFLLPAMFVSHLKGSMPAEDKVTSIMLRKSIKIKSAEGTKDEAVKPEDIEKLDQEFDKGFDMSKLENSENKDSSSQDQQATDALFDELRKELDTPDDDGQAPDTTKK